MTNFPFNLAITSCDWEGLGGEIMTLDSQPNAQYQMDIDNGF